jgi:hypothetical protein
MSVRKVQNVKRTFLDFSAEDTTHLQTSHGFTDRNTYGFKQKQKQTNKQTNSMV